MTPKKNFSKRSRMYVASISQMNVCKSSPIHRHQYHRVRECIDPQEVLYGKQKVFVNLDIVFHSCVEWLDFAYGPVRPGDMLIVSQMLALPDALLGGSSAD